MYSIPSRPISRSVGTPKPAPKIDNDKKILHGRTNGITSNILGLITILIIGVSVMIMSVTREKIGERGSVSYFSLLHSFSLSMDLKPTIPIVFNYIACPVCIFNAYSMLCHIAYYCIRMNSTVRCSPRLIFRNYAIDYILIPLYRKRTCHIN
jgi:hypothetical protein